MNICDFTDMFHNILNGIHFKQVVYILHNASQSFKSHTCVDVRVLKRGIIIITVVFKLGEHQIPELYKSVTFTSDCTVRTAATVFLASVKVDFRARSARACTVFPEVIGFAESDNSIRRYADFLCPNIECFVVIFVNRHPKSVNGKFHNFSAEFPSPSGCFVFEIVAE